MESWGFFPRGGRTEPAVSRIAKSGHGAFLNTWFLLSEFL